MAVAPTPTDNRSPVDLMVYEWKSVLETLRSAAEILTRDASLSQYTAERVNNTYVAVEERIDEESSGHDRWNTVLSIELTKGEERVIHHILKNSAQKLEDYDEFPGICADLRILAEDINVQFNAR